MSAEKDSQAAESQALKDVQSKGTVAKIKLYSKLSGPGWLQSAITLGGGSLGSSLYLGVLGGFALLWLQPFAMILGIVMLSGISYITLSTGQRPFRAINEHVNPVLGWSWALASLMANMVWCMPQYGLANAVLQQNIAPNLLGGDGGKVVICIGILILTTFITWCYGSGSKGIRFYEMMLKLIVGMIVVCFGGVVIKLMLSDSGVSFGEIVSGFIPNPSMIFQPAAGFSQYLDSLPADLKTYWTDFIVNKQQDVMISAAATAVGINMTFLLPYTLLQRKWGKEHRGLAVFDLSTGMFVPFVIATSCVVIAAASQFHLKAQPGFLGEMDAQGAMVEPSGKSAKGYAGLLDARVKHEIGAESFGALADEEKKTRREALPLEERTLAAMLVNRDVKDLAGALSPFTGDKMANLVFGIGVLGMALSTITLLMLISGFVICEIFEWETTGWKFKLSCLAACTGVLGPFIWTEAAAYLVVPTSVFGMALLPIAYLSFWMLFNQKSFLGDNLPKGGKRIAWNIGMGIAAITATVASGVVISKKVGTMGYMLIGLLIVAGIVAHFVRPPKKVGDVAPD
jgi:Mn2+/Fe2+ NRAMP family transporter